MGERVRRLLRAFNVGRFQVMALLQAARYYVLTGDLDRAKSFGLNRAIFYAWAKYYGRRVRRFMFYRAGSGGRGGRFVNVLGDRVEVDRRGYFRIGDRVQEPRDFDEQVVRKVSRVVSWDKVWRAALEYVKRFPEDVLRDPQKFYKFVYEPIRDSFLVDVALGRVPEIPEYVRYKLESLRRIKGLEDFER